MGHKLENVSLQYRVFTMGLDLGRILVDN